MGVCAGGGVGLLAVLAVQGVLLILPMLGKQGLLLWATLCMVADRYA